MLDRIDANPVRRGLVARAEDWGMVQYTLVRVTAAGETGNGPRSAGGDLWVRMQCGAGVRTPFGAPQAGGGLYALRYSEGRG